MKASDDKPSRTETGKEAGYNPDIRADATIEKLDEWVRALGGWELPPDESAKVWAEVHRHPIPDEMPAGVTGA